ncbi:MAG: replication factor C large subunit [Candidatus Woesearchaeota archaeon]
MQWTNKYSPKKISEIIGNEKQVETLKYLIKEYNKKPIFIYGPTGCGKTSSVQAIANDLDTELVELNASDTRNTSNISEMLKGVTGQRSLFGDSKIIMIDEVDGLSGVKDRGALSAILKIASETKYPIIMIGDSLDNPKLKALRKKSELLEYKQVKIEDIFNLLKKICEKERVEYEDSALKQLARMSGGDVRAAINDAQILSTEKITNKNVNEIASRNSTSKIEDALTLIFKTKNVDIARKAFDDVAEDLDKIFLWVEENLPKEYTNPEFLSEAFESVSKADIFFGRIRRWQYYRFYVYCYAFLSAGVAIAKKERNKEEIKYKPSSKLLKIWIYNNSNAKKKNIASKIAQKTHISQKQAFQEINYMHKFLVEKNVSEELDLVKEEKEWIKKI